MNRTAYCGPGGVLITEVSLYTHVHVLSVINMSVWLHVVMVGIGVGMHACTLKDWLEVLL